jgi:class 3 adenylate cyclase
VPKWFLNTNIATRLGLGFGALVLLIVIFGLSSLQQMNRLEKQSDILYHHPLTVTRSVDAVIIEALKIHREMKDLAHTVDRDKINAHESRVSVYDEEALPHLETVSSQFLGDTQTVKKVYQSLIDWRPIRDEVIQLRLAGDLEQQVAVTSQDELGRLTSTFNSMVVSIREQTEEIQRKNEENERLLLNILPGPIADRLNQGEETIADNFPEVTLLFADIVGFTALSSSLSPYDLVTMLNHLFTAFDDSAHRLGIEKIKTIGDCYMAVAGLTVELDDPAVAMVEMALEMHRAIDQFNAQHGTSFQIRIGINCGPVVAGVIGKSKFIYDLWGDTVNLASRMESHGVAGQVHVSEAVYKRVKGRFRVEPRGDIVIKGKGPMPTYLICNHEDNPHRLST